MVEFHDADDSALKAQMILDTHPEQDTWLVSDLYSKSALQTELLKKYACLPENAVLRVSELWRKILHRGFPEIEIVSTPFMATLLGEWLKKKDIPWARHPGTPRLLLQYIGELLPVLGQAENAGRTAEWLRENPNAFLRWGNWFVLAHEAWQHFCERKILASTWVGAFLSGQEWALGLWKRRLILDAGANFSGVEVTLLQNLIKEVDVHVFAPSDKWCAAYGRTLWPYDLLQGRPLAFLSEKPVRPSDVAVRAACSRFTTCLAEVKAATAQVRSWLDAGVETHRIGVMAADIETYWPSLSAYLQKEGVPVAKDVVMTASSWPAVGRWQARLKIEAREIEGGALETAVFHASRGSSSAPVISFEKFQQLFNRIYDERDLARDRAVQNLFSFEAGPDDVLSRDQFLAWSLKFWNDDTPALERIAAELLQECPGNVTLELRSWLAYLAALAAKIEVKVTEAAPDGIFCGNLEGAQNLGLSHIVVLGMSESELRPPAELGISHADVVRLSQDLGLLLNSPDRDENEFLAARAASLAGAAAHLYFAATDFSGQAQAPALFWLRQALQDEKMAKNFEAAVSPPATRWDEAQAAFQNETLLTALRRDLGFTAGEKFPPTQALKYSASQLENYLQCPFVFAAEKLFHLSDFPDVDLDVDAMTSGRVLHSLVEHLLAPPVRLVWSEDELAALVEKIRQDEKLPLGDERLWPAKRRQFVRLAKNFLEFERDWRAKFPATETVARELKIRGEWEISPGKKITVTGRVDRVDIVKNSQPTHSAEDGETVPVYAVIDYKTSANGLRNWGSWLANDDLQLAFYALALQEGLTELPSGTVAGAFYFVLSRLSREKGLRVKELAGPLFEENTRNRTGISQTDFLALLEKFRSKVEETIAQIEAGELVSNPKDEQECHRCHWSTLCRAPHLN